MQPPASGNLWSGITDGVLPVATAYEWCVSPECGAVVLFSGTVRDHSIDDGGRREGVVQLTYEAYEEQVLRSFAAIEGELRRRWPQVGRVVLLHRTGVVLVTESSVLAVVGAPHRPEAFAAARYAIDALKASAPIWKHEVWADGADWGTGGTAPISPVAVRGADR